MQQLELEATEKPGLSALGDDAKAAGDLKDVACLVFPKVAKKDPEKARNDLSDALRTTHARKLDIDEAITIIVESVAQTNRSALVEHIMSRLPKNSYEFRWLTKEEKIERVAKRLEDLATPLLEALKEAQSIVNGARK